MLVIIYRVKFPELFRWHTATFYFPSVWEEAAAAGKVKVARRDIEMKWLEGRPQAIIQMSTFSFFPFNFGSITLDVEPSAVRHLIKYLSGCTSCVKPVWNSNEHKEKHLSEWWVRDKSAASTSDRRVNSQESCRQTEYCSTECTNTTNTTKESQSYRELFKHTKVLTTAVQSVLILLISHKFWLVYWWRLTLVEVLLFVVVIESSYSSNTVKT